MPPSSGTWALGVVEVVGAVTHWSRDVCELAEEFGALLPSSLIFADCEVRLVEWRRGGRRIDQVKISCSTAAAFVIR